MSQELSSIVNMRRCWEPGNRQKLLGDWVRATHSVLERASFGGSVRHGFKFHLCYYLLLRPTLLPPRIALKMRSWMQVVNLGHNPKTHQLGWRSKGRQRYRSERRAVPSQRRGSQGICPPTPFHHQLRVLTLALQLVLCALWGWWSRGAVLR